MKTFKELLEDKKDSNLPPEISESKFIKSTIVPLALGLGIGSLGIPIAHKIVTSLRSPTSQSSATVSPPKVVVPPATKTAKEEKPTETPKHPLHFQNDNVRKLFAGFVNAEHRGSSKRLGLVSDPFQHHSDLYIRNRATTSSSAYGPVQLTRGTAADHVKRNPELFKGQEEYATKFIQQGTDMLHSSSTHPTHGLGGEGTLSGQEHHEAYQQFATSVIRSMAKDIKVDLDAPLSARDHERLITRWRGVPRQKDPSYFAAHETAFEASK